MDIAMKFLLMIEAILICFGIWRVYKFIHLFKKVKPTLRFEEKIAEVIKKQMKNKFVSTLVTREISMYYYLFSWGKTTGRKVDREFTYHEKMGYGGILGAFIFILIIEGFGVSVLLHNWNQIVAVIHFILSIYMIVFLIADYRAMKRNPIRLEGGNLSIKLGLRVNAEFPIDNIQCIQSGKLNFEVNKRKKEVLDLSLIGFDEPDYEIVLKKPEMVRNFIGRETWIKNIYLSIDQKEEFLRECNKLID